MKNEKKEISQKERMEGVNEGRKEKKIRKDVKTEGWTKESKK